MRATGNEKLMNQALSLANRGRLIDAEKLFARVCEQDPQNGKAWFMRGAIQLTCGHTGRALEYLRTAIKLEPGNTDAHFTLCKLHVSLGNPAEAMAHAKKVVDLDAEHGEAWLALSSFYADAGLFQQAEQASRTATTLLPGVAEAKINLVNVLISQNRKEEALALCKSIIEDGPAHPGIWHSLGLAFRALGLTQDAERCLAKVTKLDPNNAEALCTLGEIKAAQSEVSQALALYKKARELDPDYPRVHFELGKVLLPNMSAKHRQLIQRLEQDHQYDDISEAKSISKELATDFRYGNTDVERALIRFFDEYDPSCLYSAEWWANALMQFGDRRQVHDTALRSIYSTVFSWSLPCGQALDEVAAFSGERIASYGSGTGYWEYLLATHYGIDVVCHDMTLRHRFTPMRQLLHSDATVDPEVTIFLAWLPGELVIDAGIESLLNQTRTGQRLVLVGEPVDEYGNPRTCGTRRFFQYLQDNFEAHAMVPLANYAHFKDRVDLLVRK